MFEYPPPFKSQLKAEFKTPIGFNDELIEATRYMFCHPKHNARWYKMFNQLLTDYDVIDMLKPAFLLRQHFEKYPQQYAHDAKNFVDSALVYMFKAFISLHLTARKNITERFYRTAVKQMLPHARAVWLEELMKATPKYGAPTERIGLGTQEGKSRTNFDYLCSLGEEEQGSLL